MDNKFKKPKKDDLGPLGVRFDCEENVHGT
jgi:hypothetical protein